MSAMTQILSDNDQSVNDICQGASYRWSLAPYK